MDVLIVVLFVLFVLAVVVTVAGHLIWGLTAHLLDGVLDLAGWQRPWDAERRFDIPPRYLTDRAHGRGRRGLL